MSLLGTIGPFDTSKSWDEYSERLAQFFVANDVTDAGKKRAILLSVIGDATYSKLRALVGPQKPADLPYDDLVIKLQSHFEPEPSETVARF